MSVQNQDTPNYVEQVLERMFNKYDRSDCVSTFAACLTIIRYVSLDQPTALRQALAVKLYQLADALAAGENSR